jgi:hypothetical protein
MKPEVVCEIDLDVDIQLPVHLRQTVFRKVNIFNIGRETVPLDEKWSDGKHGSMLNVHHSLGAVHRKKVTLQVMSDGSFILKRLEK